MRRGIGSSTPASMHETIVNEGRGVASPLTGVAQTAPEREAG
jgi:hypothetical protein